MSGKEKKWGEQTQEEITGEIVANIVAYWICYFLGNKENLERKCKEN
jgi:hypothetical protein